jgi:hypothetical protein
MPDRTRGLGKQARSPPTMGDHAEHARALLEGNRYMTLGTADGEGRAWASPVWFSAPSPAELLWVSAPEARHSRNIAIRPEISIVVFDSTVPEGQGQALYMEATAAQADPADIDKFADDWTIEDVTAPAKHRLYRATVQRWWVLDEHDERVEVQLN